MGLADRIALLEAKRLASANPAVPVLRIALDDYDKSVPYCIEHGGSTWTLEAGEPIASLMDRAEVDALRRCVERLGRSTETCELEQRIKQLENRP